MEGIKKKRYSQKKLLITPLTKRLIYYNQTFIIIQKNGCRIRRQTIGERKIKQVLREV